MVVNSNHVCTLLYILHAPPPTHSPSLSLSPTHSPSLPLQPSLFGLSTQPSPPLPSSLSTTRPSSLSTTHPSSLSLNLINILDAIESHLAAAVSMPTVAMAMELSLLMMVLIKQWGTSLSVDGNLIGQFSHTLPHVIRLDPVHASPLTLHLYTSILMLLRNAHAKKGRTVTGDGRKVWMASVFLSYRGNQVPAGPGSIPGPHPALSS